MEQSYKRAKTGTMPLSALFRFWSFYRTVPLCRLDINAKATVPFVTKVVTVLECLI